MARPPLEGFNSEAMILRVQGPERWFDVEQRLRARGATMGWLPPLSPFQSLGELLENRAEGLRSALYGDAAANCVGVEAVLANGEPVISRVVPRSAAGPDWKHLLLGGRGVTGRISAATIRVYPIPPLEIAACYDFPDAARPVGALSDLLHRGAIPAIAAIVMSGELLRLILTFEGHEGLTRARQGIADRICHAAGGAAAGEGPVREWLLEVEGEQAGPMAPASRLVQPTLRVDARWSDLAALLELVRREPRADFCLMHVRHAAAALLVDAPDLPASQLANLASSLEAAGGCLPSPGPASGPVGARLVVPELSGSASGSGAPSGQS